jgi:hypothetical protein
MRPGIFGLAMVYFLLIPSRSFSLDRYCEGVAIPDTVLIDSVLKTQLNMALDTNFLNFGLGFRWLGQPQSGLSDSCSNINVHCDDPIKDTISRKYWNKWSLDVFGKYEIFHKDITVHRLEPGKDFSITSHYDFLRATKATILAISKECYTLELASISTVNPPLSIHGPLTDFGREKPVDTRFNVKGQELKSASESMGKVEQIRVNRP